MVIMILMMGIDFVFWAPPCCHGRPTSRCLSPGPAWITRILAAMVVPTDVLRPICHGHQTTTDLPPGTRHPVSCRWLGGRPAALAWASRDLFAAKAFCSLSLLFCHGFLLRFSGLRHHGVVQGHQASAFLYQGHVAAASFVREVATPGTDTVTLGRDTSQTCCIKLALDFHRVLVMHQDMEPVAYARYCDGWTWLKWPWLLHSKANNFLPGTSFLFRCRCDAARCVNKRSLVSGVNGANRSSPGATSFLVHTSVC